MAHPLDEGRDRFRRFVAGAETVGPRLPLVHSTDGFTLANILDDDGKIKPQTCSVFGPERLTYMFYGRAAYRPHLKEEPSDLAHYHPVCLIFKPDAPVAIRRIFPFDSGAFDHGFYGAYLHKHMKLGDFRLEADLETPGRVVRRFFTNNTNYVFGAKALSEKIDAAQFEALSYETLISRQGANALDSRGGGVEVQTDQEIDLAATVEAVILPSRLMTSSVGTVLSMAGVACIPYSDLGRMRPNEFTGLIDDKCLSYLARQKLIEHNEI